MITHKPGSASQPVSSSDFLLPYQIFPLSDIIQV